MRRKPIDQNTQKKKKHTELYLKIAWNDQKRDELKERGELKWH